MESKLRKEPRVAAVVPVRIYGLDAMGHAFNSVAHTLNVSKSGALLANVDVAVSKGDVIGVQRGVYKCKFRVLWMGKKGTSFQGQVGIESTEGPKNIWGVDERPHSMVREEDAAHRRTFTGGGFERERRSATRFPCDLGVQVSQSGAEMKLWSRCTDLSESGAYIETACPLSPGAALDLTLFLGDDSLIVPAEVRTSFPSMGMGVQFHFVSEDQAMTLRRFLRENFGLKTVEIQRRDKRSFAAVEKLAECVEQLKVWAQSADLEDSDREELEEMAISIRRELQGMRAELNRRQMERNAHVSAAESST